MQFKKLSSGHWLVLLVTLLLTTPIWVLVSFLFVPSNDNWTHLAGTLLPEYIANSIWLMLGVSFGTLILGIPAAWLISHYDFKFRRIFQWALLLPLAMPAYIIAYTYTGLLAFEGPVQTELRQHYGFGVSQWFPEIRSLGGAILMFSLVLYPYVYLLARGAFSSQGEAIFHVSRTLGVSPTQSFFRVALPMARPAIIAGLSLALMETLADFGTVQYFGVDTFTTGIFRTWTGLGDTKTTAQLSVLLLVFVLILMLVEYWSRNRAKYFSNFQHSKNPPSKIHLHGIKAGLAIAFLSLPILLGFVIPSGQLLYWSYHTAEQGISLHFFELIWNSFSLAFIAALVTLMLALLLAYSRRMIPHPILTPTLRIATLGYAVPGTIIAVAVMIPFTWIDNQLDAWMRDQFDISTGLLLSGTLIALIFAYSFRFLSIALQTLDSGLGQIKPSMDQSARTLGASHWSLLSRIHLPLLKSSLLIATILVFVEVLKELPTTLIMRPFNFDTLAVNAYELAADEQLADAGLPALLIVLTGIIPVIILSKLIDSKGRP